MNLNKLQADIKANYIHTADEIFSRIKCDIRMSLFNVHHPLATRTINGVEYKITDGLIRDGRKTYLVYADDVLISGDHFSVDEAKQSILR